MTQRFTCIYWFAMRPASLLCASLLMVGCGNEIDLGSVSMTADSTQKIEIMLEGNVHEYAYLVNCTLSPLMSGVMAWEHEPNFDDSVIVPLLRINAITQDGFSSAQIEATTLDLIYRYEGPIFINDNKLRWSGQFKKLKRSFVPPAPAKPPLEIGEVAGSGEIEC